MSKTTCSVVEDGQRCERLPHAHGWCTTHYMRWRTTGSVELQPKPTLLDRFLRRVDKDGPVPTHAPHLGQCWMWTGVLNPGGYGDFSVGRKHVGAHRTAYEQFVGRIPDGLHLDHLCRNRACCNPAHLEPVTAGENVLRGVGFAAQKAMQTHCINGHEFTRENTMPRKGRGGRECRQCKRDREATKRRAAGKPKRTDRAPRVPVDARMTRGETPWIAT